MKKTILYITVLLGISCQQGNKEINIVNYFDTKEFVKQEILDLSKMNLTAKKEIILNGKTEIIEDIVVDSSFLYQEFELFRDANINKPALLGKYEEDTIWQINAYTLEDEMKIVYTLNDTGNTKLKTRNMIIGKSSLIIEMKSNNFMHSYEKELNYKNDTTIMIKAWEKTLFQDTLFYKTNLVFAKN